MTASSNPYADYDPTLLTVEVVQKMWQRDQFIRSPLMLEEAALEEGVMIAGLTNVAGNNPEFVSYIMPRELYEQGMDEYRKMGRRWNGRIMTLIDFFKLQDDKKDIDHQERFDLRLHDPMIHTEHGVMRFPASIKWTKDAEGKYVLEYLEHALVGYHDDPAPDIAAYRSYHQNGNMFHFSHYSRGNPVNNSCGYQMMMCGKNDQVSQVMYIGYNGDMHVVPPNYLGTYEKTIANLQEMKRRAVRRYNSGSSDMPIPGMN